MYSCPMHPEVQNKEGGMCPECGMAMLPERRKFLMHAEHEGARGFDKHKGHSANIFKTRFWISLLLSFPVVLYSDIAQELLRYEAPDFYGSSYLPFVLASIVFFYGGWIFIVSAYRELRARLPGMMTLIALAIVTAYTYSAYVVFFREGPTLFWELTTLITVMLLGHWMEMRAVSGAQSALGELSKLLPDQAEVMRGDKTVLTALDDVRVGDVVLIKPGGKVPTDGVVREGFSEVDESASTGESNPVVKKEGSEVIAGTINGDGSLKITVTKIGDDTFLAGIMRLVAEAQASKSRLQILSDRAAYYLTLIAVTGGGSTFIAWFLWADTAFAVERAVAVLVIACPHALGLAIPLVASISTTKAAQNGLLVKQRRALESARTIDTVIFDKTGTLTTGSFNVDIVVSLQQGGERDVLQYAASLNGHSEHPLARAMVRAAEKEHVPLLPIQNFRRIPGRGVRADVSGKTVLVGSAKLLQDTDSFLGELKITSEALAEQGKTLNFVIVENRVLGMIALSDTIREESREAVSRLHQMGVEIAMMTGDSGDVAKRVAKELAIDTYFARVLPDQKSKHVAALRGKGKRVAMVGDGINDAPALAQADLGIAIGAGTNVALESAGIILMRNDPRDVVKIIQLSRATYAKMIQNIFWATGYNVVAIPLAAGALASFGIFLAPAFAALLMSASTVIVAANALLLRRKTLR